ncbi:hypothetical protein NPIL_262821 [Nephila pilipes]|uniref:Uncharacterized protein n=1 Tax=Nephila pilipes TaxID=299642 RepID=A0A8X6TVP4_NEPPI|nr:hypothetical protein NPIL_262821 [Nephila pilipes]
MVNRPRFNQTVTSGRGEKLLLLRILFCAVGFGNGMRRPLCLYGRQGALSWKCVFAAKQAGRTKGVTGGRPGLPGIWAYYWLSAGQEVFVAKSPSKLRPMRNAFEKNIQAEWKNQK